MPKAVRITPDTEHTFTVDDRTYRMTVDLNSMAMAESLAHEWYGLRWITWGELSLALVRGGVRAIVSVLGGLLSHHHPDLKRDEVVALIQRIEDDPKLSKAFQGALKQAAKVMKGEK